MAEKVDGNQKESEMLIFLQEPIYKMQHKIPLQELENLGTNIFQQGEDDTHMRGPS